MAMAKCLMVGDGHNAFKKDALISCSFKKNLCVMMCQREILCVICGRHAVCLVHAV